MSTTIASLSTLTLLLVAPLQEPAEDPLPAADPAITAGELSYHVHFLASDELEGREAGAPGARRAARYLGRALEAAGVEPAGDDGTYLQRVPLQRVVHAEAPRLVVTTAAGESVEGLYGQDFTLLARGAPRTTGALQVLRVGSLDDWPEEPSATTALFLDGNMRERREWLEARDGGAGWGLILRGGSKRAGKPLGPPRARLSRAGSGEAGEETALVTATLRGPLGEQLEGGELAFVELLVSATIEEVPDYNVLGWIRGVGTPEEPGLADEVIVFSAHYDHIGMREPEAEGEDTIFNGADDDASGTAAVLELAQAFAAGDPPARTLVFLLAAGEEKGLLGTRYYLEQPFAPLERTVCNLNFEMVGRPDALVGGPGRLWLTGFERTTLGPAFREAGFEVAEDPRPEQNFFQRSDNYAFAVEGIVAQTLSSYDLHEDYHRVTDEADTLDYAHMEAAVRSAEHAARLLASGALRPEWLPGGQPGSR